MQFSIFEGLSAQDTEAILKLGESTSVKKGIQLIQAGQPAEALLLIRSGRVELRFPVVYYGGSIEVPLENLGAGGVIGWSAMIPPQTYTLTGYTTEDSELLQIKPSDLQQYCEAHPRVGYQVMANIARMVSNRYDISRKLLIHEIQRDLKKKEDHSLWKSS